MLTYECVLLPLRGAKYSAQLPRGNWIATTNSPLKRAQIQRVPKRAGKVDIHFMDGFLVCFLLRILVAAVGLVVYCMNARSCPTTQSEASGCPKPAFSKATGLSLRVVTGSGLFNARRLT